jgi:hypothetical protein
MPRLRPHAFRRTFVIRYRIMKMLFSSTDPAEIREVRKKLSNAGIRCKVRQNPVAPDVFGARPCPELWVRDDDDILKALGLLGLQRLRQMTAVF